MLESLTRLLEAIEEAERHTSNGFDMLASAAWDSILELAAKLRAELNSVPQEDVAGRMERE